MAATRNPTLALDTYDPFGASSSSFLPPMGLFSPSAPLPTPSSASRSTPNFCATIYEEEDNDEDSSSTVTPTPEYQRRQSGLSFAIHPRILRSDSCSSDDDSDIPPVLRFPVPPSTIPTRSPPKRLPTALKPVTIPPPQQELKSCFEDDDDDDDVLAVPSPASSRRSSPTHTNTFLPARSAPSPVSATKSFSLFKKATTALKSSSSSPPRSSKVLSAPTTPIVDKPLPRVPQPQRPRITPTPYEEHQQPISVSPTPSLSSSSSASDCSTMPYIPVGSIVPAPAVVQDLDEYLETLEMYFPSELWEEQPHELRRKPNNIAAKSRGTVHKKRPSGGSACSRSSSDDNLRHQRVSSFEDAVVLPDVHRILKNSTSSGDLKLTLTSYTKTSSTSVRVSSPLAPAVDIIRSHSRSGSTSSSSSGSESPVSSSGTSPSTVTPGSRTPSPTFAKQVPAPLLSPKGILKPSKSTPLLRDRAGSAARAYPAHVPMSPTRGHAPMSMSQLFDTR